MVGIGDLSRGFIQEICETNNGEERPVVQILEARPLVSSQTEPASEAQYFRFRISDGMFSYNSCLNQADITQRIKKDALDQGNPVLRIKYTIKTAQKPLLRIMDYEILGRDLPVFGNPVHHSGNPSDYRGLNPNANIHNTRPELRLPQKDGSNSRQNSSVSILVSLGELRRGSEFHYCYSIALVFNFRYKAFGLTLGSSSCRLANLVGQNLTPIKLITPYVNKWRICGVVTAKEDLRNIRTARRDMKVFNFELTDEEGGCIRIAAFDDVAEKFYSIIQKGSMFYVSGGTVKQANKRFNTTGHDYEITIRNDSEVLPCLDREKIEQPKLLLSIVRLCNVANHIGEPIDIIAIVEKVNDIVQVTARNTGAQLEKRDVILIDTSETEITLTFWGEQARTYGKEIEGQTIGIKGAFVKEFNGSLSLSTGNSSRIELNMECAETANLYNWYRQTRPSVQARNLTTVGLTSDSYARDLRIIRLSELGALGRDSEKGTFFNVTAMISSLKADGALYKVEISDFSGSHWVTVFEDKAVKLLKNDAEQLGQLLDNDLKISYDYSGSKCCGISVNNYANHENLREKAIKVMMTRVTKGLDEYNEVFNAVRFREYTFRIRAKSEFYNNEEKIKWNVFDINEVNHDKYIDELMKAVNKLEEM
ncbi:unnamed protein product [Litomosoides sigmodontis]|uniref:Replication protein A 70 kDa DNA-binding subunit n=1 Tax=Litomosoides sigmodontis TaxID=42156 RepID=A0A3P6STN1_LITSI|nr:unnamed protein product [Litomosoides sigmodontis]